MCSKKVLTVPGCTCRFAKSGTAPNAAVTLAAEEEQKWRDWVDQKFVKLLTANIYINWEQSSQSMRYITESGNWSQMERVLAYAAGTVTMYFVGGRLPKKYGIEGDLRENLYQAADSFVEAGTSSAFAF